MSECCQTMDDFTYNDIKMVQCGREDCAPGHSYGPCMRDYYLIHFIREGRGIFQMDQKEYALEAGQLFLIPPGVLTFYQADLKEPWKYTWIGLRGIVLPGLLEKAGLSRSDPVMNCSSQLIETAVETEKWGEENEVDSLKVMGGIYFLMDELMKCKKGKEKRISSTQLYLEEAVRYIHQNIYEKPTVAWIAEKLGVDRSYFSSLFKKNMGVSPQQYILNLKIEKAKIFLEQTDNDIRYIADSLGYDEPFAFSHAFKMRTGISPSDWREKYSGKKGQAPEY